METIEFFPAVGGLDCKALGKILSGFIELANDALDGIRENSQLLEESRTFGEEHTVQKLVPVGGILGRFTAKKFGVQGFD
jgi:hypothetical protein